MKIKDLQLLIDEGSADKKGKCIKECVIKKISYLKIAKFVQEQLNWRIK